MNTMNKKFITIIKIVTLFLLVVISLYSYFSIEQFIVDNAYKENKFTYTIYHMIYSFIKYPILITIITTFVSYIVFCFINFKISKKFKIYSVIILFLIIIIYVLLTYFFYFNVFIINQVYYILYLILQFISFIFCGVIISILIKNNN